MKEDILREKLERLAEDNLLVGAIQSVLEKHIVLEKPNVETTDNDEMVGQKYRAYEKAMDMVRGAMQDIMSYKTNKTEKGFDKSR